MSKRNREDSRESLQPKAAKLDLGAAGNQNSNAPSPLELLDLLLPKGQGKENAVNMLDLEECAIDILTKNQFSARELASLISRFSNPSQNHTLSPKFVHAWEKQAIARMESFTSYELSESIHAFRNLDAWPSAEFMKSWGDKFHTIPQNSYHFSLINVSKIAYSLAMISTLTEDKVSPQQIEDLIDLTKELRPEDFREIKGDSSITAHSLWLSNAAISPKYGSIFHKDTEKHCYKVVQEHKNDDTHSSQSHLKAACKIKSTICPDLSNEHWIQKLGVHVDMFSPKYNMIIQFDGPTHFVTGYARYNHKTLFNTALLKSAGYEVERIPNYVQVQKYVQQVIAPKIFLLDQKQRAQDARMTVLKAQILESLKANKKREQEAKEAELREKILESLKARKKDACSSAVGDQDMQLKATGAEPSESEDFGEEERVSPFTNHAESSASSSSADETPSPTEMSFAGTPPQSSEMRLSDTPSPLLIIAEDGDCSLGPINLMPLTGGLNESPCSEF